MKALAERIRAEVETIKKFLTDWRKQLTVPSMKQGMQLFECQKRLTELIVANSATILAGLAALEADPAAELAKLRAEHAELRAALEMARTLIVAMCSPYSERSQVARILESITDALADSADKLKEGGAYVS